MYSGFTLLCQFLLYSKVNQSSIYLSVYLSASLLDFLPIYFTTEHWVDFPVLYTRSLLIDFMCSISTVYMSTPVSQFIPASTCLLNAEISFWFPQTSLATSVEPVLSERWEHAVWALLRQLAWPSSRVFWGSAPWRDVWQWYSQTSRVMFAHPQIFRPEEMWNHDVSGGRVCGGHDLWKTFQGCGAATGIVPTASQPASQPPCPSGGKVLPRTAGGHWLVMKSQAGLCWRGCWERCPELSEQLRGRPSVGGWWAVSGARRPSQSRVTNNRQGAPFCLWSSPGLVSPPRWHLCCPSPVGLVVRPFVFQKLCH